MCDVLPVLPSLHCGLAVVVLGVDVVAGVKHGPGCSTSRLIASAGFVEVTRCLDVTKLLHDLNFKVFFSKPSSSL